MRIELLDFFRGKKPGEVIEWPDPMAQILIDTKRAKRVDDVAVAKEISAPTADKMQRKSKSK